MVSIPTLSLATAVNITVFVLFEEVSSIALELALVVNEEIAGF